MTTPILRYLFTSEEVSMIPASDQPKIVVVQPILNFTVPFLPTQISFSVVCAISNLETSSEYNNELHFLSPSGEVIQIQGWQVKNEYDPDGVIDSAMLAGNVKNLIVNEAGPIRIVLYCDGNKIGEQTLEVIIQKQVS